MTLKQSLNGIGAGCIFASGLVLALGGTMFTVGIMLALGGLLLIASVVVY